MTERQGMPPHAGNEPTPAQPAASGPFVRSVGYKVKVPGFEGIRIHPGNTDRDTEGCILVGTGRTPDALVESRKAFDVLMAKLQGALAAGQRVTIDVVGEPSSILWTGSIKVVKASRK